MISLKKMIGLTLRVQHGEAGKLDNFVFDPESWMVRFCIIQMGSTFSDCRVLVSPFAFDKPDWEAKIVPIHLEIEEIADSTEVDLVEPPIARVVSGDFTRYEGRSWVINVST